MAANRLYPVDNAADYLPQPDSWDDDAFGYDDNDDPWGDGVVDECVVSF